LTKIQETLYLDRREQILVMSKSIGL